MLRRQVLFPPSNLFAISDTPVSFRLSPRICLFFFLQALCKLKMVYLIPKLFFGGTLGFDFRN